ncbi:MAG: hypothetical protein NT157_07015 [Candidatus Micrarchaeota archaeon]|nr:hypothetical protein [Candidatus Micrarchaeota archaeon]
MDMANADVEIIRKVMGKDGDQEKKRGIVYTLILEVEKLGMNMHPDESKAIYVRLAEALASSKFFEPMVKEALAGRRDYERRLESYKSSIDGIGAAKAFKALAEASADDVAILMAMLVRGAKNAFDDAEEYMGKSNLYELVFGFAHVLLNHEGRAHARQVRESELGPKIRDFLRSEQ